MLKSLLLTTTILAATVAGDNVWFNNAVVDRDELSARFGGAQWVSDLAAVDPSDPNAATADDSASDDATTDASSMINGLDDMRRAAARIHDQMDIAVREATAHGASDNEVNDIKNHMASAATELLTRADEAAKHMESALQTAIAHGKGHGMPDNIIADLRSRMHNAAGSASADGTNSAAETSDASGSPGLWHGTAGESAWHIEEALAIASAEGRKHGMSEADIAAMTLRMRNAKAHATGAAGAAATSDDAAADAAADDADADADASMGAANDWGQRAARADMFRAAKYMQTGLQRAISDARSRGAPEDAIKRMQDRMEHARSDVERQAEIVAAEVERTHREQALREDRAPPPKLSAGAMRAVKDAALEFVSGEVAKQAEGTGALRVGTGVSINDAVAHVGAQTGLVRVGTPSAARGGDSTPTLAVVLGVCGLLAAAIAAPAAYKLHRERRAASGDYVSAYGPASLRGAGLGGVRSPLNADAHV